MIIELGQEWRRVSLRWAADGGARDVVGHLVAANAEQLVILPEDKPELLIPRAQVRGIRQVPERTVLPTSPPEALQRVLDRTWPGLRRARLGGWVLRQGRGRTKRANSVLAVGDPGLPWRDAVDLAAGWYGATPILQTADDTLVSEATAAGYETRTPTIALVARIEDLNAAPLDGASWVDQPAAGPDPDRLAEATATPARYLSLPDVAVGRVAFDRGWAVLSSIAVAPESRGRGVGRAVVRACVAEAAARRAKFVALQVEEDHAPALALYRSEGFVEHHRYCYLVPSAR